MFIEFVRIWIPVGILVLTAVILRKRFLKKQSGALFAMQKGTNFWWGSGIASTVPKPLKHFIPQFLIAAKKRAKRGLIKKIYYWTLDDPDSMARILLTKLDGIIVNDPLKLLKVLEKEEFKHTYRMATRNDNPFSVF